jgi:hypothetical protein
MHIPFLSRGRVFLVTHHDQRGALSEVTILLAYGTTILLTYLLTHSMVQNII